MPSTLPELWGLKIGDCHGNVSDILVTKDTGKMAIEEWKDSQESGIGGILEVKGVTDTADRATVCVTVLLNSIIRMALVRVY